MKTKFVTTFFVRVLLSGWLCAVVSAAPAYVNYQGLLTGTDGQPLPTANYAMQFSIYDQAQLGTRVWGPFLFDGDVATGHGALVPVINGRFNVVIGPHDTNGAPINAAFAGTNRFMEITVAGGPPILPRQQFLSTAYAFAADHAQQAQLAQEAVIASNLVQQVADTLCPPGTIAAFGGTNIPAGWLLCDGSAVASTNYLKLFTAIGTAWGDGSYHRGASEIPANAGTDFNVPDLRGIFLRGMSGDSAMDPNKMGRVALTPGGASGNAVGSAQSDQLLRHDHANGNYKYLLTKQSDGAYSAHDTDTTVGEPDVYHALALQVIGGDETRPRNAYVNYIIKY